MVTDNRMQWIRNLEELLGAREQYAVEYELGSECYVPGLLDYADGRIICAPMGTEASRDGLWLYNLILRYADTLVKIAPDNDWFVSWIPNQLLVENAVETIWREIKPLVEELTLVWKTESE